MADPNLAAYEAAAAKFAVEVDHIWNGKRDTEMSRDELIEAFRELASENDRLRRRIREAHWENAQFIKLLAGRR